jgi:hypothetical protein
MNEHWIIVCKHCGIGNFITVDASNLEHTKCLCCSCNKEFEMDVKYLTDKKKFVPTGKGSFALVQVPEVLN